uniref:Ras-related protein Rab-2B n=1 Tax=Schistocephalus solidus TaxID=70667 RepID=A0A0X3PP60_SCHSO
MNVRRDSFTNLPFWLADLRQYASENAVIMLIGNKCDLDVQRAVSTEEGKAFARENGLLFIETSARMAINIEKAFVQTAEEIYSRIQQGILDVNHKDSGVRLGPQALQIAPQSSPSVLPRTNRTSRNYRCC